MYIDQDELLLLCRELIRIPSENPPGNEKALASFIASLLEADGFKVSVDTLDNDRANIVASYNAKNPGPTLLFTGHLDVVKATGNWDYAPFEGYIESDKLYGRGAVDMKGAIASMIEAARAFKRSKRFDKGRLMLAFVADEEVSNKGTIDFLNRYKGIDYAVIGEPTELNIATSHRGCGSFKITAKGQAGHASEPSLGINAIVLMGPVINEIILYNARLSKKKYKTMPKPTATINIIRGGEKSNIIPDHCEIVIDRRLIPGESESSVSEELAEILETIKSMTGHTSYELEKIAFINPGELSIDSSLIQKTIKAYKKSYNKSPKITEFRASCEQTFFLDHSIETIIFGPGSIDQAHKENEYVYINELFASALFYTSLADEILGKK